MCHLQNLRARCRGETKEEVMHVMQLKGAPSGFQKDHVCNDSHIAAKYNPRSLATSDSL